MVYRIWAQGHSAPEPVVVAAPTATAHSVAVSAAGGGGGGSGRVDVYVVQNNFSTDLNRFERKITYLCAPEHVVVVIVVVVVVVAAAAAVLLLPRRGCSFLHCQR